jgi:hypothetical protein
MNRFGRVAVACAALVVASPARGIGADGTVPNETIGTPERAYVRAVDEMRSLASPAYATYTSAWHSTGLGFDFAEDDGRIQISVGVGRSFTNDRTFAASYRGADRALDYTSGTQRLIGRGRLLEPTWAGAYDILRYGLRGHPLAVASPAPAPTDADAAGSPAPVETAPADIASVAAISPLFYRVEDAGTRPCAGVGFGRALHLIARTSIQKHPLTDVILDPQTGRFCSMTFVVKESGVAGITGHYTIDFAPFGSYWLVSHGTIVIDVRLFGVAAKHTTLEWTIGDVTTPAALSDDAFVEPATSP